MDLTVYLPDELGAKAKNESLNFSRLLRSAVKAELSRRERAQEAIESLGEPQQFDVRVAKNDKEHTGRIKGWSIDHNNDWDVYLTVDDRVIVHDVFRLSYEEMPKDEAPSTLDPTRFPDALRFLGVEPVVDL